MAAAKRGLSAKGGKGALSLRRGALRATGSLFAPRVPNDYLELVNPLWSRWELRGRIERIERETSRAVSVLIRPGRGWRGHLPGQYLPIGVVVDGVLHWRAYSLTSDPHRTDGLIAITPQLVETGIVSSYLARRAESGDVVHLGEAEGAFVTPSPRPSRSLFISAGSGITPIAGILGALDREGEISDVVHVHSSRTADDVIFSSLLQELAERHPSYRLVLRLTETEGRMGPEHLDDLCPDWRERATFASGPGEMLDALTAHWKAEGDPGQLAVERFQPVIESEGASGAGGRISFLRSGIETECDGDTPILIAGERAGAQLPFGCRLGICRTCIGTLHSGRVRNLRNGEVFGSFGEMVQTCINAPEGPVEIAL